MIRLFLFVLFRFFIIVLIIYLALTLLKKFIQILQGRYHSPTHDPKQEKSKKVKEEYKDVKDAKFVELPDKQTEDKKD